MNDPEKQETVHYKLEPFAYHKKLKDHFKSRKKTWDWFSQTNFKEQQLAEFKSDLLKNTYRLDRENFPVLYQSTDEICAVLGIDAQVIIYQENNSTQYNAGIVSVGREAHIVLSGNLMNLLSDEEMKALLAHELSHYLFNKVDKEEYEITQRIVLALANDQRSEDAIIETARIYQLYLELFCDAGSLAVCQDYEIVIQTLVKMNTGLSKVNAESYLEQAKEIMKNEEETAQHFSHPESYIRSLALLYRAKGDPLYETKIEKMIAGVPNLNALDIFGQNNLSDDTKELLQWIIKPKWMNSPAVMNLCSTYFSKFVKAKPESTIAEFAAKVSTFHDSVKDYFCYVFLDFARVDGGLEGLGMAHTMQIAEQMSLVEMYEKVIRKELKMSARDYKLMHESVISQLEQLTEGKEDSIYHD